MDNTPELISLGNWLTMVLTKTDAFSFDTIPTLVNTRSTNPVYAWFMAGETEMTARKCLVTNTYALGLN